MESIIFLTAAAVGVGFFVWRRSGRTKPFNRKMGPVRLSSPPNTVDDVRFSLVEPETSLSHALTESAQQSKPCSDKKICEDNLLVLSVMAQPGKRFASYDLLQAISAAGLKFGDMNIFHYTWPDTNYGIRIFSLVSAEEPGEFNLDAIGDFSCPGLMLFMDPANLPDPDAAFNIMLEKATQLAEDLDGVLCADRGTPWTSDISLAYRNKVAQFWNHPVL